MASCFRGALPPVDLRAVCFVRAMLVFVCLELGWDEAQRGAGGPRSKKK